MPVIKYGLIGHPVGHSLSPFIHQSILEAADIAAEYKLYDIAPGELAEKVPELLRELQGMNCTIPHKQAIIDFLDGLEKTADRCHSVNTVYHKRGYNTDYPGFLADCPDLSGSQVLIMGAGGVSRTMALAAADEGAEVYILARRHKQSSALAQEIRQVSPQGSISSVHDFTQWQELAGEKETGRKKILLNGTPLGLWPHTAGMPVEPDQLTGFDFVYDTVYNPAATRLLLQARTRGIEARSGLGMLFGQALAAQKIWNPGLELSGEVIENIRGKLNAAIYNEFPTSIILTGFMGSGKSTIGKMLAEETRLPFADLDQIIEEGENLTIPEIFSYSGEHKFREIEQKYLAKQLNSGKSQIVAAGGGTLLEPAAEKIVRSSAALVVYLDTPIDEIKKRVGTGEGRPMIYRQGEARMRELYDRRRPEYMRQADLITSNTGNPGQIVEKLIADLGFGGG